MSIAAALSLISAIKQAVSAGQVVYEWYREGLAPILKSHGAWTPEVRKAFYDGMIEDDKQAFMKTDAELE